ncbi:hypothetical protein [Microbacterium lacticum]
MGTYSLTVIVEGFDLDSEQQNAALDRLDYSAVVGVTGGVTTLDADVHAYSSVDAFDQLRTDLDRIGVSITRVELDLVTVSEIAERFDVDRETARLWTIGKRRSGFPVHFQTIGGNRVWAWPHVYAWAEMSGLEVDEYPPMSCEEIVALNGALAHARNSRHSGWLKPTTSPRISITVPAPIHLGGWSKPLERSA